MSNAILIITKKSFLMIMEKNNKNEELQSRREFFKRAAKGALPIIGAIAMMNLPMFSRASDEKITSSGCDNCSYACGGSCASGCSLQCRQGCKTSCALNCNSQSSSNPCGSCYNACYSSCSGGCRGNCAGSCHSGCYGRLR